MSELQGSEGITQRLPVIERAPEEEPDHGPLPPTGVQGRFWSARRVPAAVVAVLLLAVAGTFLYDVAAVRAHRPAMAWRRELARQLAQRPLDDLWVLVGAGVAAALGLWLIVLACTPGLRGVLPMRRVHPDVHAGLHREAAALVLRDRAMEVAGVQSVRIRVRRSRADVRAVSHFRDLDDVRADLNAALEYAIEGLGLARPPALSVHVRRPGRKG
ncbi:DUF6286 domain-containing protein [Streptomyces panaciradicis]|uniref:DUF6286 domain-containing protein n=1 Tax=Streptomyces panaciradicis TaxID=1470261 RepID=UPI00201D0086|nr:DUF6286 domain-containing protein [Streptomyces panaciradicis]MCL6669648.1 DUF6286 domain-containing protein [Streptomyces panaciradicis]